MKFSIYLNRRVFVMLSLKNKLSQHKTKPTIRLVRPGKTHIRAVWSESPLIARAFYSLRAIQRGTNETPCNTGWMYRLTWVFAGHTGLIVGSVVRLVEAVLTSTHNLCFEQKYEKYLNFCLKIFNFSVINFSVYLNRNVFVMNDQIRTGYTVRT